MANKNPSGADGLRDSSIEAEEILNKSRQNIERERDLQRKEERKVHTKASVCNETRRHKRTMTFEKRMVSLSR